MAKALSNKEIEIIEELISHGLSNKQIAKIVGRSESAVLSIKNGTRDEKRRKARDAWKRSREKAVTPEAVVEAAESIGLFAEPMEKWNVGEELNKLSFQIGCLTAAVTRLIEIIHH